MITGFLFFLLTTAMGLWVAEKLVSGVRISSSGGFVRAALVLTLINISIRPVLWMLTMPLTMMTFGVFALVINAFTLWLSAKLVQDFDIDDFLSAFFAALIMAILGMFGLMMLVWLMPGEVHWIIQQNNTQMFT